MKETIFSKIFDLALDGVWHFFIYVLKIASPITIHPSKIIGSLGEWRDITDIKIENRLSSELFDIYIAGISKQRFDIKIIYDSGIGGKKVAVMNIDTDRLVVWAEDQRNGNTVWIFRIQKLNPKEILYLKIKVHNTVDVHLKVLQSSKKDVPVRERIDGAIAIPFKIDNLPEL